MRWLLCDETVYGNPDYGPGFDAGWSLYEALRPVRGCRHFWWHRKTHRKAAVRGDEDA